MSLIRSILQYVWPIQDPAEPEPPLTRAEAIEHALPLLHQVADDNDCVIMGPPVWTIQMAADTPGFEPDPGRVLIARIPVEHFPVDAGSPPLDPALEEVERAAQKARRVRIREQQEVERAAQKDRKVRIREERSELDRRVAELHQSGVTAADMRAILDVTRRRIQCSLDRHRKSEMEKSRQPRPSKIGYLAERDRRVKTLHDQELSDAKIADRLGITRRNVETSRHRQGLKGNNFGKLKPELLDAKVAVLHSRHLDPARIAAELDRSVETIHASLERLGLRTRRRNRRALDKAS